MKQSKLILFVVLFSSFLCFPLLAQGEREHVFGIKNFEKSFPSETNAWDDYDNLYMDSHYDGQLTDSKLGLKTKDIIGKEMIYKYKHFDVQLVMTSDSTLYLKDKKSGRETNEKMSAIHINENTMLVSYVDANNNLVTMLSDFYNGKTSSFLYKDDGSVLPLSGSIKMKK